MMAPDLFPRTAMVTAIHDAFDKSSHNDSPALVHAWSQTLCDDLLRLIMDHQTAAGYLLIRPFDPPVGATETIATELAGWLTAEGDVCVAAATSVIAALLQNHYRIASPNDVVLNGQEYIQMLTHLDVVNDQLTELNRMIADAIAEEDTNAT